MYKNYMKREPLKAVRFKDDYKTYVFICKELGKDYEDEDVYHKIKQFGIKLRCKESHQRLFIGDYLANAGDNDFYVIRKEFMESNYKLVSSMDKTKSNMSKVTDQIHKAELPKFATFMDYSDGVPKAFIEDGLILHLDFTKEGEFKDIVPSKVKQEAMLIPYWGNATIKEYAHNLGEYTSIRDAVNKIIENNRKELEKYKNKEGK